MKTSYLAAAICLLATSPHRRPTPVPFSPGESGEYDVQFGVLHVGTGSLTVVGIDTVRSRRAYHFRLTISGGVNLLVYKYSLADTMDSWVDTAGLSSLRFVQNQHHRNGVRRKRYEIFPEIRRFTEDDEDEQQISSEDPLDDIAVLFFARTIPLGPGSKVEIPRYFKPAGNPITLTVVGRDTIEVAGRRWPTVAVRPVIKTSTMFSNADGMVWLSDDSSHVLVQLRARASFGTITMKLRSYHPAY